MKKISVLTSAILLFSLHIHGMDDIAIVPQQTGTVISYQTQELKRPLFSLYKCGTCNTKASQKCASCQGVYYCSTECQQKDWRRHKKECKKIASAHVGNLTQIENFMQEEAKASEGSEEAAVKATQWLYRLSIRLDQDRSCSTDKSTESASSTVRLRNNHLIQKIIPTKKSPIQDKKDKLEALSWVRDLTNNNKLVSPEGIKRFGLGIFLEHFGGPSESNIIPEALWKEKRLAVLDELEKELNKQEIMESNG